MKKIIKQFLVMAFIMPILVSCASMTLGVEAEKMPSTSDADIRVSSEVIDSYSDKNNLLFQINFESKDGRWIKIKSVEVDFSNEDGEPYNIIVGDDLKTWAAAKKDEFQMEIYNAQASMAGVYTAGTLATFMGVLTDSDALTAAGYATMVGVAAKSTVDDIKLIRGAVQGVALVPDSHLLAPFTLPANTLIKRWILVNFPTGRVTKNATLRLNTIEGELLSYRLPMTLTKKR